MQFHIIRSFGEQWSVHEVPRFSRVTKASEATQTFHNKIDLLITQQLFTPDLTLNVLLLTYLEFLNRNIAQFSV